VTAAAAGPVAAPLIVVTAASTMREVLELLTTNTIHQ
jgi:hypothetical protein